MNIFHSRLTRSEGGFQLQWGDRQLPVHSKIVEASPELQEHVDRPVLAGLRPEAFVPPENVEENLRIQATVIAAEALGHELIVYFEAHPEMFREIEKSLSSEIESGADEKQPAMVARLPAGPLPRRDDTLTIGVDTSLLHFFTEDQQAISHGLSGQSEA
jgi:multiple sugar transport system ATP-binding protein